VVAGQTIGCRQSVTLFVVPASETGAPAVSLSATNLNFGSEKPGATSASQAVTMTNTGNAALTISSISLTGADASSFVFANTCGTSLAAGANCSIHGHFTPAVAGTLTAAVTIADNAGNSPQSIALSGIGTGSAVASLSATSVSFGNEPVGTESQLQTVTLTNTGSATLTLSSIALTGTNKASFLTSNTCGSSVAAGANCSLRLRFDPVATGGDTAALTLTDNAGGSPQSIALSGTGGTAIASLSATTVAFGDEGVGVESGLQTVTLTNTGNLPLTLTSIALTGTDASSYLTSNTCGSSVAVGANCSLRLRFDPKATGSAPAALTLTDNAGNSPQQITLSGTGQ
jgi:P pilus assembly chaperone PapD